MSTDPARRVVANISLSLDGRISGLGGDFDMGWIAPHAISDEARDHMIAVTSPATTALLGRKNAQGFAGYWPSVADDEQADARDRAFSAWLTATDKVVFSATVSHADDVGWADARVTADGPAAVVAELRTQSGGDIVVLSSTSIIQALLAADQLDRLCITLCPEVVGGGRRLLGDDLDASSWSLVSSTPTATGAVCLIYDRRR